MGISKTIIIAIVAVVAIIIIAGAAIMVLSSDKDNNNDNGSLTVTDGLGKVVTIDTSDKIASTSTVVTEIICGLGGYSKLAGVADDGYYGIDDYNIGMPNDGYPKSVTDGLNNESLKNLGGMYMMSAESILLSKPDLVIMGGYFNNDDTISQLENLGIPVVVCKDDNTLDNIYFNIELIGKAIGKESEAKTLVEEMKSSIEKIVNWTESLDATPERVAVLMGFGSEYGTYANGNDYLMGTPLITMLGGINAFSSIPGMYDVVSTESIVSAKPDVIIDATPESKSDLDSIKTDPLMMATNAAKNDRIYGVFDNCALSFAMTSQGFVNSIAIMAMFMYEDQLDFTIDHYMGNNYADYLEQFWEQMNS